MKTWLPDSQPAPRPVDDERVGEPGCRLRCTGRGERIAGVVAQALEGCEGAMVGSLADVPNFAMLIDPVAGSNTTPSA